MTKRAYNFRKYQITFFVTFLLLQSKIISSVYQRSRWLCRHNVHLVFDYAGTMSTELLTMLTQCQHSSWPRWHRVGNSLIGFLSNSLFFVSERAKELFTCEKGQIAPIALLSWATWANRSQLLFCSGANCSSCSLKRANGRRATGGICSWA